MKNKIEEFARLLENDQLDTLIRQDLSCDANVKNCLVKIRPKKKYTCVDVGNSGKYMIDNNTGEIFGIKGYGKVNKNHYHGTLETIYNYYWGRYSAMPSKADRRPYIKNLLSVVSVLAGRGLQIDENGNIYGGAYGERKQPEPPKAEKVFNSDRYIELAKDLKEARIKGIEESLKVNDSGTCNLDGVFIRLKGFNEEKTLETINNSGLGGFVTDHPYFKKGYYIGLNVGQALKREKAAETMYKYLDNLGYDVSHWQQMD
jgi:hypothetical protein